MRERIAQRVAPAELDVTGCLEAPRRRQERRWRHAHLVGERGQVGRLLAERIEDRPLQRGASGRRVLAWQVPDSADLSGVDLRRAETPDRLDRSPATETLEPAGRAAQRTEPQQLGIVEQALVVELGCRYQARREAIVADDPPSAPE